ncbi:hypothetical protein ACH5RR_033333 [Cinchona calisaya]|uniref:Uncharacterized protein n=1 Tax=Cinchona calisaya TaxID=153742 RepID=A0ABD2YKM3_9GENT
MNHKNEMNTKFKERLRTSIYTGLSTVLDGWEAIPVKFDNTTGKAATSVAFPFSRWDEVTAAFHKSKGNIMKSRNSFI